MHKHCTCVPLWKLWQVGSFCRSCCIFTDIFTMQERDIISPNPFTRAVSRRSLGLFICITRNLAKSIRTAMITHRFDKIRVLIFVFDSNIQRTPTFHLLPFGIGTFGAFDPRRNVSLDSIVLRSRPEERPVVRRYTSSFSHFFSLSLFSFSPSRILMRACVCVLRIRIGRICRESRHPLCTPTT